MSVQTCKKGLFLSVCADVFNGQETREPTPARLELGRYIKLDPPTPLHASVYFGCGQRDSTPEKGAVEKMKDLFTKYSQNDAGDEAGQDIGNSEEKTPTLERTHQRMGPAS